MATYVIPQDDWDFLDKASEAVKAAKDSLVAKWEELGAKFGFIPQTASPWDEEKRMIEAEPVPNPEYIRRKQALMVIDALHKLEPEDRKLAVKLMEHEPACGLAQRVEFLQGGSTVEDAILAEAAPVAESEGVILGGSIYKKNADGELVNMGPAPKTEILN